MPFMIVQTLEDGKKVLSCVPEGWVKNNCLAWPRKKADKLTRVENSFPGVDWFLMPCKVKRSGLTYDEGQLAISIMTQVTDTEEDETPIKIKEERKVSQVKSHNDILECCLEKAAVESIMNEPLQPESETQAPKVVINNEPLESTNKMCSSEAPSLKTEKENILTSSTYMESNVISDHRLEYFLLPSQETNSSKNDTTEKLDSLTVTVNAIVNIQNELQQTQQQLLLRMISMQAQFEEFLKKIQKENLQKEIGFSPINCLDSLQNLEDTLKDQGSTTELINKFSIVCGTGKGRGLNNCFTLVDIIFDRSFLTTCSWAGGARGEDKKKICFKSFERVINLFFCVIYKSDKNFTMKECEEFFKNILRNSNRRNTAKMARTSATKIRVKKHKKGPKVLNSNESGPSQKDAAAPKTGPSQENAAAAPKPGPSHEIAAAAAKTGPSQENAAAAPKAGPSQENAAAAPESGQNQSAAVPEPGESQNVAPAETAQN